MEIEEVLDEGPLEPGALALEDDEAAPRDLGGLGEIEEAASGTDLDMGLRGEGESGGLAPGPLDAVGIGIADRDGGMGKIGNGEEEALLGGLDLGDLNVERGDLV